MNFTEIFKTAIKETEAHKVPTKLMQILYKKEEREALFLNLIQSFSSDLSEDWFHEYFQEEQAERKGKKQDFTPMSVAKLLSGITETSQNYYEVAGGTGGLVIAKWWHDMTSQKMCDFKPSNHLYTVEELSERTIPFLIFNCAIRGMNAIIIHGDSLTRETKGVFFIQNDNDDFLKFSSVNVLPYSEEVEMHFNIKFGEFRYKELVESPNTFQNGNS